MLSLVGELSERLIPGESERVVFWRKKLKCRSFATLLSSRHSDSGVPPYDVISEAAQEYRLGGYEKEAMKLEELSDTLLEEKVDDVLLLLVELRKKVPVKKEDISSSCGLGKGSYSLYPPETFTKDFKSPLGLPIIPLEPSFSFFSLKSLSNILAKIPDLHSTISSNGERRLRAPLITYNQTQCSSEEDDTSIDSLAEDATPSEFPWDNILDIPSPSSGNRRTWESPGVIDPPKALPYASECINATLNARAIALNNLKFANIRAQITDIFIINEGELMTDIGYLLIGIASRSFGYNSASKGFYLTPGLSLIGITPETLSSYVQDYIHCGTYFRRLEKFVVEGTLLEGLIFKNFQLGIDKYLQGYRTIVLKVVSKNKTLMDLSEGLRSYYKHIFYLAKLCNVCQIDKNDCLPRGILLLNHLFDMTLHVNSKDLYFVLVSILRTTATPYFRFLERWMFEGVCHDEFSEFGLIEHGEALIFRDRRYWDRAYSIESIPNNSVNANGGTNFINDVQKQVYLCGKALNFLKLCQPNHYLCCTTHESQPGIHLLVTPSEEMTLKKEVINYTDLMNAIAKEKSMNLKMHKLREAEKRSNLAMAMREKHEQNLKRIYNEIRLAKEKEENKKRLIFEDLKEQARRGKLRREKQKELDAKEDKEWMEKFLKKEREEIERENAVKKEMEEYYQSLIDAADKREKISRWKIKRNALRPLRIKFWRVENLNVSNFLQNQVNDSETMKKEVILRVDETISSQSVWKSCKIRKDDQQNILIDLEDQESNILTISVDNWSSFSEDEQKIIASTGTFSNLPERIKNSLLKNCPSKTVPKTEVTPRVAPSINPHVSSITFDNFSQFQKEEKTPIKSEITVVDGRKRPISKHIEDVMYEKNKVEEPDMLRPTTEFKIESTTRVEEYTKNYFHHFSSSQISHDFSDRLLNFGKQRQTLSSSSLDSFTPLSILMENSILIPLRSQMTLVNQAVLNHMLIDVGLLKHFEACRNYLLFYNGEFGHNLAYSLFEEIAASKDPHDLLNPSSLNRLVDNAMLASTFRQSKEACNVGFKRNFLPSSRTKQDILSSLELTYRSEWPYNIILTQDALNKYGQLFKFFIQLKKALWALHQVFQQLKQIRKAGIKSIQGHKLHLMRNEMLNFLTVAQGYISSQVLDLTWQEFQQDLEDKVESLEDLYDAHEKYLNKALFRCLLNKKAKPVQKIISDIFNIIVSFSLTMTKVSWSTTSNTVAHPLYNQLEEYYNQFKEYSTFLYQVVSKLSARGYQHHLHDLMLRLNFNEFYQPSI